MSHAELCNLLRRASAFLAPYSFIPCRNNKMSVQELARIFVKDTMQVPNSIDALAGLLGLQSDQNKALFHEADGETAVYAIKSNNMYGNLWCHHIINKL